MKFRAGDSLLSMSVIPAGADPDLFVVFENGVAKRTPVSEWTAKGRGIYGVTAAKSGKGGHLVGALTVEEGDEVMVVMERGNIVRTRVDQVSRTGRITMGVAPATPNRTTRSSPSPATPSGSSRRLRLRLPPGHLICHGGLGRRRIPVRSRMR